MSDPVSTVRALTCPNCGGTVALRAAGYTVSIVCEHCGSALDATDPDLKMIARARDAMLRPEIPLGTRAELRGVTWEVIGYLTRTDNYVSWSEYLLFNPYEGYAFLIDDGRRFSLGFLLDRLPSYAGIALSVDGADYERFGRTYGTRVTFVVGEFYWRVAVGEEVSVADFVRPGTMVSAEENDGERTWTRSDLLDFGVVEKAFGLPKRARGFGATPAPHEPSPYRRMMKEAMMIGAVAMIVMFVIMSMAGGTSRVGRGTLAVKLDGSTTTEVITPIALPDRSAAVRISAAVGQLDNSWIDLDYSLVDRATQENFDGYALAEHYSGSDSDGPWQEGSTQPSIQLSGIPAGSYDLVVEATGHRWGNASSSSLASDGSDTLTIPVGIEIARGGLFAGNFFLAMFLLACWPLIVGLLHFRFEKRRMAPVTEDDD